MYRLKRRGVTLLLPTHYMDEAEQLCDRLLVMDKGKIVAQGSPRELIERYSTREVLELRIVDGPEASLDGAIADLAERIEKLPDRLLLYTKDGERTLEQVHSRHVPYENAPAVPRHRAEEPVRGASQRSPGGGFRPITDLPLTRGTPLIQSVFWSAARRRSADI